MTQKEFERKLMQLKAEYIERRAEHDKAVAFVKKNQRKIEAEYRMAMHDIRNKMDELKEEFNVHKNAYVKAEAELYAEFENSVEE